MRIPTNVLDHRLPPGYSMRDSEHVFSDGHRHVTWHGHGLDGLPMRTVVCGSEAECIGKLWLEYARPPLDINPGDALYIRQLKSWRYFRTFERIDRATECGRKDIRIRRSSGEFVEGYMHPLGGGASGMVTGVRWVEDDDTNRYKSPHTADFIDWNPQLFKGLDDGYKGPRI